MQNLELADDLRASASVEILLEKYQIYIISQIKISMSETYSFVHMHTSWAIFYFSFIILFFIFAFKRYLIS